MNRLLNTAFSSGDYNGDLVFVSSNVLIVDLVDKLVLVKSANKDSWDNGYLTYKVEIKNNSDFLYENAVLSDVLNDSLVDFVNDSVVIEGTDGSYYYDDITHSLVVNLESIDKMSDVVVSFKVRKKQNEYFVLDSCCKLSCDGMDFYSNWLTIVSTVSRRVSGFSCDVPFWRK